eukprot:3221836-Rhodomonas_salina.1
MTTSLSCWNVCSSVRRLSSCWGQGWWVGRTRSAAFKDHGAYPLADMEYALEAGFEHCLHQYRTRHPSQELLHFRKQVIFDRVLQWDTTAELIDGLRRLRKNLSNSAGNVFDLGLLVSLALPLLLLSSSLAALRAASSRSASPNYEPKRQRKRRPTQLAPTMVFGIVGLLLCLAPVASCPAGNAATFASKAAACKAAGWVADDPACVDINSWDTCDVTSMS